MSTIIQGPSAEARIIRERKELGLDRHDETWYNVYMIMPIHDLEHQAIATNLSTVLNLVIGWPGLDKVFQGVNISDRSEGWEANYRCPDIAVYLKENPARPFNAHWQGGPDLAVEVLSPHDEAREKLTFYAEIKTRERLLIDRGPWSLELDRLEKGALRLIGASNPAGPAWLASEVLPLHFRLVAAEPRPRLEVRRGDDQQTWAI